jgi:competence protein ComEA
MGEMRGRAGVLLTLGVLAVLTGVVAARWQRPVAAPVSAPGAEMGQVDEARETVTVHVSGRVVSPGVVDVPADAIVADVVDAAGGALPDARIDSVNLAAPVAAGEHIVIPGPDGGADEVEATTGDGVVSLNQATVGDLETLPGVGPVLAERIVAYRDEHGRYQTVEDLLEVPGIGEAKLAAMRDLVRP